MKQSAFLCVSVLAVVLILSTIAQAGLVHRYNFNGDANDSVGTAHGTPISQDSGAQVIFSTLGGTVTLGNDGTQNSNDNGVSPPADPPGAYIDLPNGTISSLTGNQATFETWFTYTGNTDSYYQRIFDFGTSDQEDSSANDATASFITLCANGGAGRLSFYQHDSSNTWNYVLTDTTGTMLQNVPSHIVVTWDGANDQATVYCNGVATGCVSGLLFPLADLTDNNNWLGRSNRQDTMLVGSYNEFRIYDQTLSPAEVYKNYQDGPNADFVSPDPVTPTAPTAGPIHSYSFDGNCNDSVGTAHGTLVNNTGNCSYANGKLTLGNDGTQRSGDLSGDTTGDYVDLPDGMISGLVDNATFEFWASSSVELPTDICWERLFDFGTSVGGADIADSGDGCSYIYATSRSAEGSLKYGHREAVSTQLSNAVAPGPMTDNEETHVVCVWDGDNDQITLYVNGEFVSTNETLFDLSDLVDVNNWLGRAQYANDRVFEGSFDEFQIYDYALTAGEALYLFEEGPPIPELLGDANHDNKVDAADVSIMAANWGAANATWEMGDFSKDGSVGPEDAKLLAQNWGTGVGGEAAAVPEPSILFMTLCGLIALIGCRRSR